MTCVDLDHRSDVAPRADRTLSVPLTVAQDTGSWVDGTVRAEVPSASQGKRTVSIWSGECPAVTRFPLVKPSGAIARAGLAAEPTSPPCVVSYASPSLYSFQ